MVTLIFSHLECMAQVMTNPYLYEFVYENMNKFDEEEVSIILDGLIEIEKVRQLPWPDTWGFMCDVGNKNGIEFYSVVVYKNYKDFYDLDSMFIVKEMGK